MRYNSASMGISRIRIGEKRSSFFGFDFGEKVYLGREAFALSAGEEGIVANELLRRRIRMPLPETGSRELYTVNRRLN